MKTYRILTRVEIIRTYEIKSLSRKKAKEKFHAQLGVTLCPIFADEEVEEIIEIEEKV